MDAVIIDAVRTPIGRGKSNGAGQFLPAAARRGSPPEFRAMVI
ncbi:hypothetical protein [Nocardia albiluteola]|nr:hypothetical protein [Nocardia albiluteola]